jgi:uncharacterized protein YgiM (DUF1202 family)
MYELVDSSKSVNNKVEEHSSYGETKGRKETNNVKHFIYGWLVLSEVCAEQKEKVLHRAGDRDHVVLIT